MPNQPQHTGCCPPFDPEPWKDREITWTNELFIRDRVRSFFHIPLNMNKVMTRDMELIQKAGAEYAPGFVLSDECSLWGSNIYVTVSKEVPGAETVTLPGTYLTKVFEGSYKNIGKWVEEMKAFVHTKGKELQSIYFGYTTCPKCAKAYGRNYVVLFAKVG